MIPTTVHPLHQLDPSVKTLWSIRLLITTILLTLSVCIGELSSDILPRVIPFGAATATVFVLGVAAAFTIPALRYRSWGFSVHNNELHVRRGILTHIYTIAPTGRIQHLDVAQSLTERMLGLSRLVVYTAGTRGADIVIPGLHTEYAQALRDYLKNISVEDAV